MPPERVAKDIVVTLQYKLWDEDGDLIEETDADDPLVYLHGHDNIIPGLERALNGLAVGDQRTITVDPADAYGEFDPDLVIDLDHDEIPSDIELEIGTGLELVNEEGVSIIAFVSDIDEDSVMLDGNHPLAGLTLRFEVQVAGLREATREELEHGHAHAGGHHHH